MNIDISIVIPIKNEQENIRALAGEITVAMDKTTWKWEVIWINDGSTDESLKILELLAVKDPRQKHITLFPSEGQSAALIRGFQAAQADIFATLDGDGQNDPADIPRLIEHLLKTKADMVNGRRLKRNDPIPRKIVSGLGNRFRNIITGESLNDVGCAIRVFYRRCVKDLSIHKEMKGMHRFLPTVSRLNGFRRLEELSVNHRARVGGTSKYTTLSRLPGFLWDTYVIKRRLLSLPRNPRSWGRPPSDRRRS